MNSEQIALAQVQTQLHMRGFSSICMPRNCKHGDIHARKGTKLVRFEVKGLEERSGVWLKERQVKAVDIVVIYVVRNDEVWVLSPTQAVALLENYRTDFILRNGRPPAAEGFNKSQFPKQTGWEPLDRLL
jgi:hypothetical protein